MSPFLLFLRIYSKISNKRKFQLFLLLILILCNGIAEICSIGILLPFVTALIDIELIWSEYQIQSFSRQFGFTTADQLLLPLTIIFVVLVIIAAIIKMLNLWCTGRLAAFIGSDLSCQAYSIILSKPYSYHINTNSSSLITGITKQINFIIWALNSSLQLVTGFVVSVCIISTLIFVSWKISIVSSVVFGLIYFTFILGSKNILKRNSHVVAYSMKNQLKSLQEGLGSIRDVIMDQAQLVFVNQYQKFDLPIRIKTAQSSFIATAPRHFLESTGLLLLAIFSSIYVAESDNPALIIPLIGTLALGSQKLLPAFQQIYGCLSQIRSVEASILDFLLLLENSDNKQTLISEHATDSIIFDKINFANISYTYKGSSSKAINNVSIEVRKGAHIGIIGTTGSGKSTIIDIMMGLLTPDRGRLIIDDIEKDLNDPITLQRLRSLISHVPQQVYLSDASISENIAFGVSPTEINTDMVIKASKMAQLHDFIKDLPLGYDQFVGEKGVKLSGGQKQRIGLARALYRCKPILILDEATSALDNETEFKVNEALAIHSSDITTISIAHRLSTLRNCDYVYSLSGGKVENVYSNKEFNEKFL